MEATHGATLIEKHRQRDDVTKEIPRDITTMARKPPLADKVYEVNRDQTHYAANSFSGNVTLCGQTDWIGQGEALPTDAPVDCAACLDVVKYVQGHKFD